MSGRSGTATCALGANQKRGRRLPYCLLLIALLLGAAILQKDVGAGFPTAKPRSSAQWAHLYAALPLSFEANCGQTDRSVNFLSHGRGFTLFLTGQAAVLTLKNPPPASKAQGPAASGAALRLQLLNANANAGMTGRDELPGKANYFIGNDPSKWHRNVPTYAKVRYEGVYPGIDLVYYGNQGGELEYDFLVAPGADPKAIALGVETDGHAPLRINSAGNLVVQLPSGDVQLHKPVVYQQASPEVRSPRSAVQDETRESRPEDRNSSNRPSTIGNRQFVEGHFALDAQNHVRFELGPYDHNRPLVIDPVLIYATYVGGFGGDVGYGIAVDSSLDAYIAGVTNSANYPATVFVPIGFPPITPVQATYKGNGDAFVTKMNSAGTQIIYSTYLGGSQSDSATAIAIFAGNAYITGNTNSVDFPLSAPIGIHAATPFQGTYGGNTDAFVAQIDSTGDQLVYSSYLGGSGADFGQGIAVDTSGGAPVAVVTGATQSTNFPTLSPLQATINGSQNAFVSKVNSTGEALLYSTYLGGSAADVAQSIQVDSTGNTYIAGYTFSSDFLTKNVPVATPIQSTNGGGADGFVAKLNAAGSALTFATYLGGSGDDRAYGIALDGSQNVYVTGATTSLNFPIVTGAFQPALKGASDAFICKLNPAGTSLLYSTYLGGSGVDQGNAIAVTSAGVAYVAGFTESSDFPTHNPLQPILGLSNNQYCGSAPCADAFVTQLNVAGNALTYSTYLGGSGPDFGQSIALDSTGDPYITGSTSSTNFPAVPAPNATATTYIPAYKTTLSGTAGNMFVAKIDPANESNISIVPDTLNFGNETISVTSALQQVTIVNPSTAPLTITSIVVGPVGSFTTVFTETDNCLGTIPGGSYCTMNVAFTPASVGTVSDTITLTDNAGGVVGVTQTITLTGTGATAATSVTVAPTSLSFSSQNVGTISPPQSVTITNTGTATLNITQISTGSGGDFSQTNTCAALSNTLGVGQSCNVSVTFSPTASGTRAGSLTISDTATGSPQTVALSGIGAAAFTLTSLSSSCSSSTPTNPTIIGSTQAIFCITASAPSTFNGTISLACSAGSTCAFNPTTVGRGGTSTLTISNLTTSLPNPYAFQVVGTSGSQTSSVQVNLLFEDFTLSATPSNVTIQAGTVAPYKIIINPLNTFNQKIGLLCASGLPPASTCSFDNATPTPDGSHPTSVGLSINTVKYIATTHTPPLFPTGKLPPLIFGLLSLAGLASLTLGNRRRSGQGWLGAGWLGLRLAMLSLILALNLAMAACRPASLAVSGTTTGNYIITVSGTLVSNTVVVRTTTLNLSVTSTAP